MTPTRTIPFIVATIFMDAVGFGIIMPVLPQLVMEVGRFDLPHAIEVGAWIGLVMAVATFLASPVLGNLSDHFGRRRVLLLALGGLAIDYALLTIVQTLPWLFVARALSGIFGSSYAAAQAAIADITKPEERARNFGFVGAAFGIGFVAGPAIGGLLGEISPRAPFVMHSVPVVPVPTTSPPAPGVQRPAPSLSGSQHTHSFGAHMQRRGSQQLWPASQSSSCFARH